MDEVFNTIKIMDLPLVSDKPMLGGGNCAFHALIQQGRRACIKVTLTNHDHLRRSVCQFAMNSAQPEVLEYQENYNKIANDCGTPQWVEFFRNMERRGVWAEGPVLPMAAIYLNHNIYVISTTNYKGNPWLQLSGGEGANLKPPIIMANAAGVHYQSVLPIDDDFRFTDRDVK